MISALLLLFPSPYGDFVFQRAVLADDGARPAAVSVPLRGFCFSTYAFEILDSIGDRGFRPLTGILFFNTKWAKADIIVSVYGFRPLTGILFFNKSQVCVDYLWKMEKFPSPYGDFVFQREMKKEVSAKLTDLVSVPLRGFCFSTRSSTYRRRYALHTFPSPYGDFVFQPHRQS